MELLKPADDLQLRTAVHATMFCLVGLLMHGWPDAIWAVLIALTVFSFWIPLPTFGAAEQTVLRLCCVWAIRAGVATF